MASLRVYHRAPDGTKRVLSVRVVEHSWLVRLFPAGMVDAFAFRDRIYLRGALSSVSDSLLRHELFHLAAQWRVGCWRWLARYMWRAVVCRFTGKLHPDELEAEIMVTKVTSFLGDRRNGQRGKRRNTLNRV